VLVGGFCTIRKAATRKFGTRLATKTKRVAAKSIAAIPAESIPFIGVAVLIADTGYELYAACETVKDLGQLYADLGIADEMPDDVMHSVCDPKLPDAGDVWGGRYRSVVGELGGGCVAISDRLIRSYQIKP
jgi:hypothetical protein